MTYILVDPKGLGLDCGKASGNPSLLTGFGSRVHVTRARLGLAQEELGHRPGLHGIYVSSVECGERSASLLVIPWRDVKFMIGRCCALTNVTLEAIVLVAEDK